MSKSVTVESQPYKKQTAISLVYRLIKSTLCSKNMIDINNYRNLFRPGGFARNVISILSGNIAAQGIVLFTTPIITRLYIPDDFGTMTFVWSIIQIFGVIVCMRYEAAIVISPDDREANDVFVLCLFITLSLSFFIIICQFIGGQVIANLIKKPDLKNYLWFVPIGVTILGCFQAVSHLNTRKKQFFLFSFSQIITVVSTASIKIIAAFLGVASAFWLVTGNITGQFTAMSLLFLFLTKSQLPLLKDIKIDRLILVAKRYKDFPKYRALTGLLNSFSQNLPIFLFSYFFSSDVVGFYGLTTAVLTRPVSLVSKAVQRVFLQKASEIQARNKDLKEVFIKTTLVLGAIGVIPFMILMMFGKWLFGIFFGPEWKTAGIYVQLLSPWFFMMFINTPATQTIIVKQKLHFNLLFDIAYLIVRLATIVIGYYIWKAPIGSILLFSASGVIANFILIYYAYQLVKN